MITDIEQAVLTALVGGIALIAIYFDVRWRRIPNWLTYPAMLLGFIVHGVTEGWNGVLSSGSGMAVGFFLFFIFYLLRLMGGGDVKLMAAMGALVGIKFTGMLFFLSAFAGASISLAMLLHVIFKNGLKHENGKTRKHLGKHLTCNLIKNLTVPYGVAISMGAVITLLVSFN